MRKIYKCKTCGGTQDLTKIDNLHEDTIITIKCSACETLVSSKVKSLSRCFDIEEAPDIIGEPPLSAVPIVPLKFWRDYIQKHVEEFYQDYHFAPNKFKLHLEPGKSYIIAEGIHSTQQEDGRYIDHKATIQTKRFPDQFWASSFWEAISGDFDLPSTPNRVLIEGDTNNNDLEVKVAVTLRKSVQKTAGRSLTEAEKDMLTAQVINTTKPDKPEVYYVAKLSNSYGLDKYLDSYGVEVSRVKRAARFPTVEQCQAFIHARKGHGSAYHVNEVRE